MRAYYFLFATLSISAANANELHLACFPPYKNTTVADKINLDIDASSLKVSETIYDEDGGAPTSEEIFSEGAHLKPVNAAVTQLVKITDDKIAWGHFFPDSTSGNSRKNPGFEEFIDRHTGTYFHPIFRVAYTCSTRDIAKDKLPQKF